MTIRPECLAIRDWLSLYHFCPRSSYPVLHLMGQEIEAQKRAPCRHLLFLGSHRSVSSGMTRAAPTIRPSFSAVQGVAFPLEATRAVGLASLYHSSLYDHP